MNTTFYDNMIFARNLKDLIGKKGMSQIVFATRVGVSRSVVTDWIKGRALPRVDTLDTICDVLGCRRSDLCEEKVNAFADDISRRFSALSESQKVTAYNAINEILKFYEK